jgi:hypothetical protein
MSVLQPKMHKKVVVGLAVAVASVAATTAAQARPVTAAVPAASISQVSAPLALGGPLSPACLGLVSFITNPVGPFGPFGIILTGGPVGYVGAVTGFVFGSPAAPGLLQVCA